MTDIGNKLSVDKQIKRQTFIRNTLRQNQKNIDEVVIELLNNEQFKSPELQEAIIDMYIIAKEKILGINDNQKREYPFKTVFNENSQTNKKREKEKFDLLVDKYINGRM